MTHQLSTRIIILQLEDRVCYTPVSAARLGEPGRVERNRRKLQSITKNHSFKGFAPRTYETADEYRARLVEEYGEAVAFRIVTAERQGKNGRCYLAFSGFIYKQAIGEDGLVAALQCLSYLILCDPIAPYTAMDLVCQDAELAKLLEDHRSSLGLPPKPAGREWQQTVQPPAAKLAVDWLCGGSCFYPVEKPGTALKLAMLKRLVKFERRKTGLIIKLRRMVESSPKCLQSEKLGVLTVYKGPGRGKRPRNLPSPVLDEHRCRKKSQRPVKGRWLFVACATFVAFFLLWPKDIHLAMSDSFFLTKKPAEGVSVPVDLLPDDSAKGLSRHSTQTRLPLPDPDSLQTIAIPD